MNHSIARFFLHFHPKKVRVEAIRFDRTFGLGGIAALLFVILFITGMLLRFAYIPSAAEAYDSIVHLQQEVLFGSLLRNLHYWSAMLLVVVAFLHLVRVFYSQSIFEERRKNWIYGLVLLFLVLSANFTGYLLPWDQLSYWAVTIMTNMLTYIPIIGGGLADLVRGGDVVNENTLLRFYHFHTGLMPFLMIFFMSVHFWLVRKSGGVTLPAGAEKKMVDTHPHLVYKEIVVALILLLVLFLFSVFADAPLLEKAKPLVSPNPSRAPWYFMGFQELLMHIHPTFGSFIIPLLVLVFFISIPFMKYDGIKKGVWFYSYIGKQMTIISAAFAVIYTFAFVVLSDTILDLSNRLSEWPSIISTGLLSCLIYFIPVALFILYLKRKKQACRMEMIIAIVTFILAAYITMMLTGSFLRGEGMQLIFLI
jgi:quinol-cytochrome oxidoreductase complex cytochrome b subunit